MSRDTESLEENTILVIQNPLMWDVVEVLDHDSDHLPIGMILDLSHQNTASDTRYSYDHINTNVFKSTLSASLLLTPTTPPTPEVLNIYVTQLINAIPHIVHIFTPQTVPNVQVTPPKVNRRSNRRRK